MARPFAPLLALPVALLLSGGLAAQAAPDGPPPLEGAIAVALDGSSPDVRAYNDHVVILASPFMEGRVPGSRGMEIASEYVEHHLRRAGLEAPFDDGQGGRSYRQPFPLAEAPKVVTQHIGSAAGDVAFAPDVDFRALGLGGSGEVTGELVFVGYAIEDGPDGYDSFADGTDLTGKVALVLRFEPMDAEGRSLWARGRNPWSPRAGFARKFAALKTRNPAAVVLVNPPGSSDPRADRLLPTSGAGSQMLDVPVIMVGHEAGERLLRAVDPTGPGLMDLREEADAMGGTLPLGGEVTVSAEISRDVLYAENVGGLLPGKGELADELIVVGAHLDHLGMGDFGSRSGPGELHPGADDNASGCAAIIMLGERLAADYEALPEGTPARSVLFLAFSAEESGLNGSRHYVTDPVVPLEDHALMVNFDMIGRITDRRLSVSGTNSGDGMKDWLGPYFERTGLEIVQPANMSGRSDHSPFYDQGIPVLFGILADFHQDYHTPRDVSWKINRTDAVATIDLFHEIGLGAATRPERFAFQKVDAGSSSPSSQLAAGGPARPAAETPDLGDIKVRFGITPGSSAAKETGVPVASVSEGTSASEAGIRVGDRLVQWNGKPIPDVLGWLAQLARHSPGDVVQVDVMRGAELLTLWVTLQGKAQAGG